MHIGDLIRLKRKSHRLTQIELSKKILSYTENKICKLEKNPKYIVRFNLNQLNLISELLEIDIDILIKEQKKYENSNKK